MKKTAGILLTLILALSLFSCKSNDTTNKSETEKTSDETTEKITEKATTETTTKATETTTKPTETTTKATETTTKETETTTKPTETTTKATETTTKATETETNKQEEALTEYAFLNVKFKIPSSYSHQEDDSSITFHKYEIGSFPGIMITAINNVDEQLLEYEKDFLTALIMADDVDVDSIETFTNDKKVIIAKASKQFEKPDNTEMNDAQVFYFMDVEYIYTAYYVADGEISNYDKEIIDSFTSSLYKVD